MFRYHRIELNCYLKWEINLFIEGLVDFGCF